MKIYKTAIYLRLSNEDEQSKDESTSITNQRLSLKDYIDSQDDLIFQAEYVDDGYSGYDFSRPKFVKMLEDAEKKLFDCILVRDLSRLGRNFISTEEYLRIILPEIGIRFISLNNNIDSNKEMTYNERLTTPIINMANEFYVSECSLKIRRSQEMKRKNGDFIGNFAVYGYKIVDKKIVVDEDTADIVKMIFTLKIQGYSNRGIAKTLNENDILCPSEYKISKNISIGGFKTNKNKAIWSENTVKRILENPVYTGILIQGKTTTLNYKDKKRFVKDKSKWDVKENAHEAIISATTFEIVRDLMSRDCWGKDNKYYLFSGFLFCENCGKYLYRRVSRYQQKETIYWFCRNTDCKSQSYIKEELVYKSIFYTLKTYLSLACDRSKTSQIEFLKNALDEEINPEISRYNAEIQELKILKQKLQIEHENGKFTTLDYGEILSLYDGKIQSLEVEIDYISKRKERFAENFNDVADKLTHYQNIPELTREILVSFINKIVVTKEKNIKIDFRFADFLADGGGENYGS